MLYVNALKFKSSIFWKLFRNKKFESLTTEHHLCLIVCIKRTIIQMQYIQDTHKNTQK